MAVLNALSHPQLDILATTVSRLPKPLAMYLDSIGNVTIDGLNVTPRLSSHISGFPANFSITQLDAFLELYHLARPDEESFASIRDRTSVLFSWNMAASADTVAYQISALDATLYSGFPTQVQISSFCQIIETFTSIPGYLTSCDITHGNGAANQCVRVISDIKHERQDYYVMCEVPSQDEVLACVFHLGQDIADDTDSYFVGSHRFCRRRGDGTRASVIPLLMN